MRTRALVLTLSLFTSAAAVTVPALGASAAPSVIVDGLTDSFVAPVNKPTAIAPLPDGRILLASQTGELTVLVQDGSLLATPALALGDAVCPDNERGLLGVVADPDFRQSGYLFVYYTARSAATCVNRVSRFTMVGDVVSPSSELILLDNMPSPAGNHNGGGVVIGNDGMLYASIGDGGCSVRQPTLCSDSNPIAQDLSALSGKVMRITRDGGIPPDNPFTGAGTARCNTVGYLPATGTTCREIFAYGLRNPFRMALDMNTSSTRLLVADVGLTTWEEVDDILPGRNYGWPLREGPCAVNSRTDCTPTAPYTDPILAYDRDTGCGAITGVAVVPDVDWPANLRGGVLAGDFNCFKVAAFTPSGAGYARTVAVEDVGPIVAMTMVKRGTWSLYYTSYVNGGEVHRISPVLTPGTGQPGTFHPVTPTRILDTRSGIGYAGAKPAAGASFTVHASGPLAGVPDDAVAVAVNLTGTESDGAGFVTLWPEGEPQPTTSNLNFARAGDTAANAALVRLRLAGELRLFTQTGAHLVLDVTGYWTATASAAEGRFLPAADRRLLDTRLASSPTGGVALPAGGTVDVAVGSPSPAPGGSGRASAVALVVTITDSDRSGFVTVWPTGSPRPVASAVNPTGPGDIRSNLVLVPVGPGGTVSLYTKEATHLVVDLAGWFTDATAAASSSGLFVTASPTRLLDTRDAPASTPSDAFGRVAAGTAIGPDVTWFTGLGARVLLANVTVDGPIGAGFMTLFGPGATLPTTSNLNWSAGGQTRAAAAIVEITRAAPPPGAARAFALYTSSSADAVVDGWGWFTSI